MRESPPRLHHLHDLTLDCREELFYQLGLRQFGNFRKIKLEPPPPVKKLVALAVDIEEDLKNTNLHKDEIVDVRIEVLSVGLY